MATRLQVTQTKSTIGGTAGQRNSMRNEYYWFSRQPHKQYRLGLERVKAGEKSSYYSQGVGAEQVAKNYALRGRKALCLRWAKKSEKAWLNYFKVMPDWYNSYLFYAASLGYQGKIAEMDKAFATGAKIAGKTKKWKEIVHHRKEVMHVRNLLESSSRA